MSHIYKCCKLCLLANASKAPTRVQEFVSQKGFFFLHTDMCIMLFFCHRTSAGLLISLHTKIKKNLMNTTSRIGTSCHSSSSMSMPNQFCSQDKKCSNLCIEWKRIWKFLQINHPSCFGGGTALPVLFF